MKMMAEGLALFNLSWLDHLETSQRTSRCQIIQPPKLVLTLLSLTLLSTFDTAGAEEKQGLTSH